jgi:hypothetical protein
MCNNILISNIKNPDYLIDFNRRSRKARQNKARAVRPDAGEALRAAGKIFIPQRACTGFCDMFNMRSLSPNDDSQGGG